MRKQIFRGYADIGYESTKKIYYYGFKAHAIVSDDGYLLDYIVTKASVHDAKETVELITNAHPDNRYLLGDEGYLGKDLHQRLEQMGYTLWTPYRKNMKNAQKHNKHYLMALRRTIESDFSLLSYYNAENNRARSLAGFQERLEVAILAYNMAYCLERFNQHHAQCNKQNCCLNFCCIFNLLSSHIFPLYGKIVKAEKQQFVPYITGYELLIACIMYCAATLIDFIHVYMEIV